MRPTHTAIRASLAPARARPSLLQASFVDAIRGRRQLHLSSIGDGITWTAESLSSIHAAGVPWLVTIPLVAVGVNFTLRLPVQYYLRQLAFKRKELEPLVKAWVIRHRNETLFRDEFRAEARWRLRVARLTGLSQKRIYKSWGCQRWKSSLVLLSFAPLIVISESLRRLCGAPLGMITRHFGLGSSGPEAASSLSAWADRSLADGGVLWFVDLTAADPYMALPTICTLLLAYQVKQNMSLAQMRNYLSLDLTKKNLTVTARLQESLGRFILVTPLLPLLFSNLPSAIFVYWASSSALNLVNASILDRLLTRPTTKLKSLALRDRPLLPRFLL
ncbi:hypothetical protein HIM_00013 [Hirsutella minnesotensis 3608]|nr:hypothetical protein HIM_00013 [Hirsutella minnesotensis 3608]